jgi:hypothetical protein
MMLSLSLYEAVKKANKKRASIELDGNYLSKTMKSHPCKYRMDRSTGSYQQRR